MKKYLLTPGPTPVPEEVALAGAKPIIHHRTPQFGNLLEEVTEGLKYVFQTHNDVFVITASGTGGMEACVVNTVSPQDKVLVLDVGVFGQRWEKIIRSFGVEPETIHFTWGQAVDVEMVKRKLAENPEIKVVFTQLTETSTGVVNDIKRLGEIVKETPAILVVDAVSGLAGQEMKTDEWNVDIAVAGSQKGFMLPPGLAFISVSPKAWKIIENSKLPKFYWDLKAYKKSLEEKKQTPYTPAVNLLFALAQALKMIKEEGLENVFLRHKMLASALREGVKALGLELFAQFPCEVVTSVKVPEGIDGKIIVKKMRDEYGINIAGGQQILTGKIFRIAHMGYMDRFDVIIALSALEMVLTKLGYKVELGASIKSAEKVFLQERGN